MEDPPSADLRYWNNTLNLPNLNHLVSFVAQIHCFTTITNQTETTTSG